MWLGLGLCLVASTRAQAEQVYLEPETFLSQAFAGDPPKPKALWITSDLREEIENILGHSYGALRLRYWYDGARSAWILEAIGKSLPMTTGIVIESDAIAQLDVLIYRESHGWEVHRPAFTNQFHDARLTNEQHQLDRHIDGISGATLSVNALTRLARLALFLDTVITTNIPADDE